MVLLVSFWWDVLICIVALVGAFYVWSRQIYRYWKNKGIPGPEPSFPLGNTTSLFLRTTTFGHTFYDLYNQNKQHPFFGVFMLQRKTLVINDLDLVKIILVKDFTHFSDHSPKMNDKYEPLSAHLFNLTGEKWKNLRNKLTPTFTSSRIRNMFGTVAHCGLEMVDYLEHSIEKNPSLDLKDLLAKFNTDVIGSCAFGIECNSFKNPDAEFRKMGKRVIELSGIQSFLQMCMMFAPWLLKPLKTSILGEDVNSFFLNTVKNTIQYREENGIVRNDFLQLLIQLKNTGSIDEEKTVSAPQVERYARTNDRFLLMVPMTPRTVTNGDFYVFGGLYKRWGDFRI